MPSILSTRAMLARLTIRAWSARKLDRKITDEVNSSHGAAADAGRYNKLLISADSLATLAKIGGEARNAHYVSTLPWADEGSRILPAAAYLDYTAKMREFRVRWNDAAALFVAAYPDYVADARARLNGMFRAEDYPPAEEIGARFALRASVLPCPDASDFRVDIGDTAAAEIRADIEAQSAEALVIAMRDVWSRIADRVEPMVERLKAYKPGGKADRAEGVFRDSLVENVRELVSILPILNITGDAALTAMASRLDAELCRDSAAELRENPFARQSVAAAAESILSDVSAYLA